MISDFGHVWRLAGAGLVLARYENRLPDELRRQIPFPIKIAGAFARLFGGSTNRASADKPSRLASSLTRLGPAYVKLGQFLATRPDVLGPELAAELRSLQDRMPPFAQAQSVAIIERELGKPLSEIYSEFSEPIAAASIAQVHRARLASGGDAVAVKVLRPDVEKAFARDLSAFAFAARKVESASPEGKRLEPVALVQTLAASVKMELDLRFEGAAASEIAEASRTGEGFFVPEIHWSQTARRVLTTQWIDAIPMADLAAIDGAGIDRPALARQLMTIFLTQALRDGLFHADMHPGNLFVIPPSDDRAYPLIAAVDFGIIGRLDKRMRRFMAETLHGFLMRDYRRIADAHYDVGFVQEPYPREDFAQALRSIGEPIFGRQVRDISMARLLAQLFEVTRLFDMHLQPQLVLLQKTMVVVEGVAREIDPDLDIWAAARPVVETWMMRELGPEARIQEAAETAVSLARVAMRAPDVLTKMEAAAGRLSALSQDGLRLHPESARAIAEEEARRSRNSLWILWAATIALAVLAATAVG